MVEGIDEAWVFISTLNPIFVHLDNYTDLTRSETLSILRYRGVGKIFNKYSESSVWDIASAESTRSDKNVPALFYYFRENTEFPEISYFLTKSR